VRQAPFATIYRILILSAGLIVLPESKTIFAQVDRLGPTRAKLSALQSCLGPSGSVVDSLRQGLFAGWTRTSGKWHPAPADPNAPRLISLPGPPPPQYLDSLDLDLKACNSALEVNDEAQRQMLFKSVVRDISIKAKDCKKFGMGRMVSVRVITIRGRIPDDGWIVYYKWSSVSSFPTSEVRFPQLSSPAVVELPPGEYVIRAEKRVSGTSVVKLDPAKVVVGSKSEIELQFPIL